MILQQIKEDLVKLIKNKMDSDLNRSFVIWCLNDKDFFENFKFESLSDNLEKNLEGALKTYKEIAGLGFLRNTHSTDDQLLILEKNLNWLSKTKPLDVTDSYAFESNGVALLGLALGCSLFPENLELNKWIVKIIRKSVLNSKLEKSDLCLIFISFQILGINNFELSLITDLLPCLNVFLFKHGFKEEVGQKDIDLSFSFIKDIDEKNEVLNVIKLTTLKSILDNKIKIDYKNLSVNDVISILDNIPHSLKRWTWKDDSKWDIKDETQFQNFLWAILSPIVDDIDDEEFLKSVGQTRPKPDFVVSSLNLAIEAKYMREATQSELRKIINEITADAGMYCQPGSGCDSVIVVIWDNSRSTEQAKELIQGLENISGIKRVIVVPRPGRMK